MTAVTYEQITKTPDVCGGEACIRGHRVPVWSLVGLKKLGANSAQIFEAFPALTTQDLEAAWDYYAANQAEIDRAIYENEEGEASTAE